MKKLKEKNQRKIVYLADMSSPHAYKLADFFSDKGYQIFAFSEFESNVRIDGVKYYHVFPLKKDFKQSLVYVIYRLLRKLSTNMFYRYRLFLFTISGLSKEIEKINPDFLHAHFCSDYGRLAYHLKKYPYIVSCWGSDILLHPSLSKYICYDIRKTLNNASLIHTCAKHLTSKITDCFNIPKQKIIEIQYGIKLKDIRSLSNNKDIFKTQKIKVICTRAAKPVYNNEIIIKAAKILENKGIDIEFFMFSSGVLFKKYQDLISDLQLKHFHLSLSIDQNILYEYYKNCDIYVSASTSDGLSISLLEAFVSKLFPIVSNITANSNVIKDNINGFLFEPNDHIGLAERIIELIPQKELFMKATEENHRWVLDNQILENNLNVIDNYYKLLNNDK